MKTFPVSHVGIKDHKLVREMHSRALVNVDKDGLEAYRDKKKTMDNIMKTTDELQSVKNEVGSLKKDLEEIKNLLIKLASG